MTSKNELGCRILRERARGGTKTWTPTFPPPSDRNGCKFPDRTLLTQFLLCAPCNPKNRQNYSTVVYRRPDSIHCTCIALCGSYWICVYGTIKTFFFIFFYTNITMEGISTNKNKLMIDEKQWSNTISCVYTKMYWLFNYLHLPYTL